LQVNIELKQIPLLRACLAGIFCLLVLVVLTVSSCASVPNGFAALGSRLPADMGMLGGVPKIIKQYNLTEMQPDDWKNKEKWGITISSEDRQRGYIVFSRHYIDPILAFSLPNNRINALDTFASPGEYEPLSFAIYPLVNASNVSISAGDLSDGKGHLIKSENIDLRVVRSIPFVKDEKTYVMEPMLLEKLPSVDLQPEKCTQFWITVYTPKKAAPGDYTGIVHIKVPDGQSTDLKLHVKVLPITLRETDTLYGMCWQPTNHTGMYPKNLDKYYTDMMAHGMNSQWIWPDAGYQKAGGRLIYDFTKFGYCRKKDDYYGAGLDEMMAAYMKSGYKNPWCFSIDSINDILESIGYHPFTTEYDAAFLDYVSQLIKHIKDKKWPEYYLLVTDEPGGRGYEGISYALYYYKLLKSHFPAVKTISDVGPWAAEDAILAPYVDAFLYACQSPSDIEKCRQRSNEFSIYNQGGWGRFPRIDRDRFGIYASKTGAKRAFMWVYTWWWTPTVPPSWHPAFMYVVPAADGPIPTISWEALREGIDDSRYLHTLELLINRAKSRKDAKAQELINEAESQIQAIYNQTLIAWEQRDAQFTGRSSESYDVNRWKIAQCIIKLNALLEHKTTTHETSEPLIASDEYTTGLWHFDEGRGSSLKNSGKSPENNGSFKHFTGKGSPLWTKGISGTALQFTSDTDPVCITLNNDLNPQSFSYEVRVNFSSISDEGSYIGQSGDRFILRLLPGGIVDFVVNNNGWKELSSGHLFSDTWHHVAASYDGEFIQLYVDGNRVGYLALTGSLGGSGSTLMIGTGVDGKTGHFKGKIDEVQLSSTARHYNVLWK